MIESPLQYTPCRNGVKFKPFIYAFKRQGNTLKRCIQIASNVKLYMKSRIQLLCSAAVLNRRSFPQFTEEHEDVELAVEASRDEGPVLMYRELYNQLPHILVLFHPSLLWNIQLKEVRNIKRMKKCF